MPSPSRSRWGPNPGSPRRIGAACAARTAVQFRYETLPFPELAEPVLLFDPEDGPPPAGARTGFLALASSAAGGRASPAGPRERAVPGCGRASTRAPARVVRNRLKPPPRRAIPSPGPGRRPRGRGGRGWGGDRDRGGRDRSWPGIVMHGLRAAAGEDEDREPDRRQDHGHRPARLVPAGHERQRRPQRRNHKGRDDHGRDGQQGMPTARRNLGGQGAVRGWVHASPDRKQPLPRYRREHTRPTRRPPTKYRHNRQSPRPGDHLLDRPGAPGKSRGRHPVNSGGGGGARWGGVRRRRD